jgi:hypothetical protein
MTSPWGITAPSIGESPLLRHCRVRGNVAPAGPKVDQRGIDMSLRTPRSLIDDQDQEPAASLAFGVHCSVFKKRVPDGMQPETAALCRRDTYSPVLPWILGACQPRRTARNTGRVGVLVSTGPVVPGREGKPACGARDKTSDLPHECQTVQGGVLPVTSR